MNRESPQRQIVLWLSRSLTSAFFVTISVLPLLPIVLYTLEKDVHKEVAALTQAIEQGSRDPDLFYRRSLAFLRLRDHDGAVADIVREVELDPAHGGIGNEELLPSPPQEHLDRDALQHGAEQVNQLLRDRPVLQPYVKPGSELHQWLVRQFAGAGGVGKIRWDSTEKTITGALNYAPTAYLEGTIQVSRFDDFGPGKGRERSFEVVFSNVMFECENIRNARHFYRANRAALSGLLTRDEYVVEIFRAEHEATLRTRVFYAAQFYPWAKKHSLQTNESLWHLRVPLDYQAHLKRYSNDPVYPWQYYRDNFDQYIAPHLHK